MDLREPVEALGEQDLNLLDVALGPAAVARRRIDDRRRGLFIAADNVACDLDAPASAAEQGGFDEVVAEDLAAEGLFTREIGERCVGGSSS